MSASPRISVIVPVYNGARTLARALESIFEQSFPACEVIVVDDGSTDDSVAVARSCSGNIQLIQQENQGVSAARNRGVEQARGEWVAFLDADDWFYPDRLKAHASLIERYPAVELLSGNFEYWHTDGSRVQNLDTLSWKHELVASEEEGVVHVTPELRRLYAGQHVGDTHTLTIRKDLFTRVGGYPEGVAIAEDMCLLLKALDNSKHQAVVLQPLAAYFVHPESVIRSDPLASQRAALETYRRFIEGYDFHKEEVAQGANDALRRARLDLSYSLIRHRHYLAALTNQLGGVLRDRGPVVERLRDLLSVVRG
ncbi:glycosyltransferase [Aestuariirhabdus litorea]|uniref:Glycosyltransferase n=2 Tax=Aestuariirhabdus litorea TaxID=2528527 RepID=A0A3P3VQH1_9GAMM|nr:glycosyltransferase [Aestuariirhabdus litorea]